MPEILTGLLRAPLELLELLELDDELDELLLELLEEVLLELEELLEGEGFGLLSPPPPQAANNQVKAVTEVNNFKRASNTIGVTIESF